MTALVHSYNAATVQLGMDLGLEAVIDTLKNLGLQEKIDAYPSLLLGAVELPPIDVLQMYQTIAAGGYETPLRAILAVTDQENNTLQRYPLTVQQNVDPGAVFCLSYALQAVTTEGTGRSLQRLLPEGLTVAGKTGTTDNLRDSWFAGYSSTHVAVAWVGRDDNMPTGLTGATGALGIWAATMAKIDTSPLRAATTRHYQLVLCKYCYRARFLMKTAPSRRKPCCLLSAAGCCPRCCNASSDPKNNRKTNNNSELEKTLQKGLQSIFDFLQ